MKQTLHNILFVRVPIILCVCLSAFVATLFFVPFSPIFLSFALGVGIIDAIIEIDRLTGGKTLIYFSLPIIFVGEFIAESVAFGDIAGTRRLMLLAQFMAAVLSTDAALTIIFRSRIESVCTRKLSR